MCAIIDADVVHQVLSPDHQIPAGRHFLAWISKKQGHLVIAGKLLKEYGEVGYAKKWLEQAIKAGTARKVDENKVNARCRELKSQHGSMCKINDFHVIALAQISGARLLYTNDKVLQAAFKDLVRNPKGKVYTTRMSKQYGESHKALLRRNDLCRTKH